MSNTYTCYNCQKEFNGQPNEVSVSPVEIHFYCDTCLQDRMYIHDLVADELDNAGFKVNVINGRVIVSLDNRRVDNMEVKEVLSERFEGISFDIQSAGNSIAIAV